MSAVWSTRFAEPGECRSSSDLIHPQRAAFPFPTTTIDSVLSERKWCSAESIVFVRHQAGPSKIRREVLQLPPLPGIAQNGAT